MNFAHVKKDKQVENTLDVNIVWDGFVWSGSDCHPIQTWYKKSQIKGSDIKKGSQYKGLNK